MKRIRCRILALCVALLTFTNVSGQDAKVSVNVIPDSDQSNASVAIDELNPKELYSLFDDYVAPGALFPSIVRYSFSPAAGAVGSWNDLVKPPDAPFVEEWHPWVSAIPRIGGFGIGGSQREGAPWTNVVNAIVMNVSPGGGAPFGVGVPLMFNAPAQTWLDYPVIEFDDDPASPALGNALAAWVEYIDGNGGDIDGNGNPFDEVGDFFALWSASTDVIGGPGTPYPAFNGPAPITAALPVLPGSMGSHRPAIDWVGSNGNPIFSPGAAYVAFLHPTTGTVFVDAAPNPAFALAWGGLGPVPVATFVPVPATTIPGVHIPNGVTIAVNNAASSPCSTAIHVAWTSQTPTDIDIFSSTSFDGGLTWSAPVRVNQDPVGNGLDQWAPHMRVNEATGEILVTYYDRRNSSTGINQETWLSKSCDCGKTWRDQPISTAGPTPPVSITPHPSGDYIGEYLGSDWQRDIGRAYTWNDGRNAIDQNVLFSPSCCVSTRGNVNCSPGNTIDISDLTALVDHLFITFGPLCCVDEADTNGDCVVDVSDITVMVNYLFVTFVPPKPC